MTLPVSVIVVSRGRPRSLVWTLAGIAQLLHPLFEVVVVADPAGIAAAEASPWSGRLRLVPFDEANISAARNLGLRQAAGEVVAFIDDDAVPEPTWACRLMAPFAAPEVAAAGGFVRGRNGISYQWRARIIRADGGTDPLEVAAEGPTLLKGHPGRGIKTEGTNMAIRRDVIARLGGFDPAFRFYLDESDVNLRLAAEGAVTAIVPAAEVHHGFAESGRRRADRVPRDLTEIGASLAVFLRKHAGATDLRAVLDAERAAQRRRLLRHMVAGRIEPRDVGRILAGFDAGLAEGRVRPLGPLAPLGGPEGAFRPFREGAGPGDPVVLSGWRWQGPRLRAEAAAAAAAGRRVTLFLLSPSPRRHRVAFDPDGYWVQSGGLFGRSDRADSPWQWWRPRARLRREVARVADVRALGGIVSF